MLLSGVMVRKVPPTLHAFPGAHGVRRRVDREEIAEDGFVGGVEHHRVVPFGAMARSLRPAPDIVAPLIGAPAVFVAVLIGTINASQRT